MGERLSPPTETWPPSLWREIWALPPAPRDYWLTRFLLLRLLGLVYVVAFATLLDQGLGLLGSEGLLPIGDFLDEIADHFGSRSAGFRRFPSIFWWSDSNLALQTVGWVGLGLSLAVLLGYANGLMLALLWALHLSVVHAGQRWYSFGWETQLLETGFLAIFLVGFWDGRPFGRRPPPILILWLYRWLIVRIMLGAGLIKLRGDACWTDLTCLVHHYETQPIPNPLSPLFHFMPRWFHQFGVLFTFFVELLVPLFAFGPRVGRHIAGILFLSLQFLLIASGNLSYLNWLTIVPILACFDDGWLRKVLPRAVVVRAERARECSRSIRVQRAAVGTVFVVVAALSVQPVANLFSSRQLMNSSFDRLHLVNTYGAFGSVGKVRPELIFEGTTDPVPSEEAQWHEFEFPCKPGDVERRPCWLSPYHLRLDWLLWFAAMGSPAQYPWAVRLVDALLRDKPAVMNLVGKDPFPRGRPRFVRVVLYRYEFGPLGADEWWRRERLGLWLPPLSSSDPRLLDFLGAHGWSSRPDTAR